MSSSMLMYEEYDQMVAAGMERQKKHEQEMNNNIRGQYIDKLGVTQGGSKGYSSVTGSVRTAVSSHTLETDSHLS